MTDDELLIEFAIPAGALITFVIINLKGSPLDRFAFNPRVKPEDIERIFISHGHIDHFGGVANIAEFTEAAVGVQVDAEHAALRVVGRLEQRRAVDATPPRRARSTSRSTP